MYRVIYKICGENILKKKIVGAFAFWLSEFITYKIFRNKVY